MNSPTANNLHGMCVVLLMFAGGNETVASDRLRHDRENGQEVSCSRICIFMFLFERAIDAFFAEHNVTARSKPGRA